MLGVLRNTDKINDGHKIRHKSHFIAIESVRYDIFGKGLEVLPRIPTVSKCLYCEGKIPGKNKTILLLNIKIASSYSQDEAAPPWEVSRNLGTV